MKPTDMTDLDRLFDQYVKTALWSETDESDESGGVPLEDNYGPADFDNKSLAVMRRDCETFLEKARPLLDRLEGVAMSQHGHDFWLDRNGHGTGFWDRDYPEEIGEELSRIAEGFGECLLIVEEGKVEIL